METGSPPEIPIFRVGFPVYLQGMETIFPVGLVPDVHQRSQSTYKEWKLSTLYAPALPVHPFPVYLQGMETGGPKRP